MPDYNPNAIWGSKEKKYVYRPPGDPTSYTAAPPGTQNVPPVGASLGNDGPKRPSFFRRHGLLFFTIGIFFTIALATFIYYLLSPAPTPNVVISFSDPGTIMVGVPFPIIVTVSDESKSVLQNAVLNIMLPSGFLFASGTTPTQSVGILSSQTINPPETFWLVATEKSGGSLISGTTQVVNTTLTYQTAATGNTTLRTTANASLTIGTQSALTLSPPVASSSIFSGQNFDIVMSYQNNTTGTLQGIQLTMQYPPAYHFVSSSSTTPTGAGNNIWNLGTLAANATGTLVITGNIVGPAQAHYQLNGTIGATFSDGQNYPAFTAPVSFVVTPSPLSLTIALNSSSTYVAKLGDNLNYTLTYTNNSNVTFQSVNISAALVGQMYNFSSLQTSGSFNSQSNTITWFAANTPALASLSPGQSGTVSFTISTQSAFPIKRINDKDYSLNVTAKATSPTVPPNTAGANTTSIAALTNKVGGVVALSANGYVKETTPGIANTGPYPPKVNQPTEYTIHWNIVNYSTDATSVTVSAYLQSGTTFTGVATSTGIIGTSTPIYDAGTGLVTWTIPFIPATTGVISPPAQAVFQVTNTPAVNQVGQTVTLMGPTTLTATDVYTGAAVTTTALTITTRLSNDPAANGQTGEVTQ